MIGETEWRKRMTATVRHTFGKIDHKSPPQKNDFRDTLSQQPCAYVCVCVLVCMCVCVCFK